MKFGQCFGSCFGDVEDFITDFKCDEIVGSLRIYFKPDVGYGDRYYGIYVNAQLFERHWVAEGGDCTVVLPDFDRARVTVHIEDLAHYAQGYNPWFTAKIFDESVMNRVFASWTADPVVTVRGGTWLQNVKLTGLRRFTNIAPFAGPDKTIGVLGVGLLDQHYSSSSSQSSSSSSKSSSSSSKSSSSSSVSSSSSQSSSSSSKSSSSSSSHSSSSSSRSSRSSSSSSRSSGLSTAPKMSVTISGLAGSDTWCGLGNGVHQLLAPTAYTASPEYWKCQGYPGSIKIQANYFGHTAVMVDHGAYGAYPIELAGFTILPSSYATSFYNISTGYLPFTAGALTNKIKNRAFGHIKGDSGVTISWERDPVTWPDNP